MERTTVYGYYTSWALGTVVYKYKRESPRIFVINLFVFLCECVVVCVHHISADLVDWGAKVMALLYSFIFFSYDDHPELTIYDP